MSNSNEVKGSGLFCEKCDLELTSRQHIEGIKKGLVKCPSCQMILINYNKGDKK